MGQRVKSRQCLTGLTWFLSRIGGGGGAFWMFLFLARKAPPGPVPSKDSNTWMFSGNERYVPAKQPHLGVRWWGQIRRGWRAGGGIRGRCVWLRGMGGKSEWIKGGPRKVWAVKREGRKVGMTKGGDGRGGCGWLREKVWTAKEGWRMCRRLGARGWGMGRWPSALCEAAAKAGPGWLLPGSLPPDSVGVCPAKR